MRMMWVLAATATSLLSPLPAQAFDRCDRLFAAPEELREFLIERGVRGAAMKYFEQARAMRLETAQAGGRLFPAATFEQGRPVIVYPAAFPPLVCRLALATFLVLDGEPGPAGEAARDAGRCITAGRPRDVCLLDYARDLEQRYRASFAAQDEQGQKLAYGLATEALAQIARHEYAHHLLGHAERIRSGRLARIDAEFEADFYALLNGIQGGETAGAMYYFFDALAEMEEHAEALKSPDYESGDCRARNVDDITRLFGIAPIVLLDAVHGGGSFRTPTPDLAIGAIAEELARSNPPSPSAKSCGRLAQVVLREAHAELTRLLALVAEYADVLPATRSATDLAGGLGLTAPAVFKLIDRLQAASQDLVHLKGLAVRALSILVMRVGYGGATAEVSQLLDRAVQSSVGDILASDYGRMLKVKALSILYDAPDRPLAARMDEAQPLFETSVTLLPEASEGWMNLAYIAFAKGDCAKAVELADQSVRTGSDSVRDTAEAVRDRMREIVSSGRCAEEAKDFASTFGR